LWLIGTVIFLVSAFMPLISIQALGMSISITLIDVYTSIGKETDMSTTQGQMPSEAMPIALGFILTLILYPVTVILGFVSLLRRKLVLVAGILGIICWIGAIWAIAELKSLIAQQPFGQLAAAMIQYGIGIFAGIAGAIIILVAYFLKPKQEVGAETTATTVSSV